jgi:hypothetical protein
MPTVLDEVALDFEKLDLNVGSAVRGKYQKLAHQKQYEATRLCEETR